MPKLLYLIITLVTVAYPLIVYFGLQRLSPAVFSVILIALALGRYGAAGAPRKGRGLVILLAGAGYGFVLALSNSQALLLAYPTVVSWTVGLYFALSLRDAKSAIEQLAEKRQGPLPRAAQHYVRRLTAFWAVLLFVNGGVALTLALFADLKLWALYTGLLSYGLFGLVFAVELWVRRRYKNKHSEPEIEA